MRIPQSQFDEWSDEDKAYALVTMQTAEMMAGWEQVIANEDAERARKQK